MRKNVDNFNQYAVHEIELFKRCGTFTYNINLFTPTVHPLAFRPKR